jgi:hypothetical protein
MSYSKVIQLGKAGSINISESAGVASVAISISEASGGSLANVAKGTLSAEVSVSAAVLIDALLGLVASKYPSSASLISGLEAIINAEIVNL